LSEEERVSVQRNFATWEERMKSVDRADRAEKERWDRLVKETELARYPPPVDISRDDYTDAQKNFFQTDFTEWKTLCQSARAARERSYSIPQNFANISRSGQRKCIEGYAAWKKERTNKMNHFLKEAPGLGYAVPNDVALLSYAAQEQLYENFENWRNKKQQASVAAPGPGAAKAPSRKPC
jgi:hypothetical protein